MDIARDRTLVVIRHAKSSWSTGQPDRLRPLNMRGKSDAPHIGRWLRDSEIIPQYAHVSAAERTQQTWAKAGALLPEVPTAVREELYGADAATLLAAVRRTPGDVTVAALVCHMPGCQDLTEELIEGEGDRQALARMSLKYPTSGMAVISLAVPWAEVGPGSGRLVDFVVPRG